ncbi:MAG: hypothetical protein WA644_04200, partial [Candidatus Acidiferrales bacterium]
LQQLPLAKHFELLLALVFHSLIGFPHSGSPLKIEFATRTLSDFGSRAAASFFRFQLKAGQLPSQPEIVQRIYGIAGDFPGSDQAVSAALNGWGRTVNGRIVTIRSAVYQGQLPPQILISQLSQRHPILLGVWSGPTSGHAVVVTAASYINSPSGPIIISLVIRDPWPSPQNIATAGRVEYTGPNLPQFAGTMRAYWLVTVQ